MTLKDRAEKMIDTLAFNRKWDRKTRIRYYVAEFEEAEKGMFTAKQMDNAINKAWAAAREETYLEAAKIVRLKLTRFRPEEPGAGIILEIDADIRARAAEFKSE